MSKAFTVGRPFIGGAGFFTSPRYVCNRLGILSLGMGYIVLMYITC
jgi:hypothetical protein